jgi:hypothetical protein
VVSKSDSTDQNSILGLRQELSPSPTPSSEAGSGKPFPVLGAVVAFLGFIFLGISGFYFLKTKRQGYTG